MDFETLLAPYSDPVDGEPTRTVQGQMAWLTQKKGFELGIAQLAIARVYFEISGGLSFEDLEGHNAGWHLDQYLLKTAIEARAEGLDAMVKASGDKLEQMINKAIVENRMPAPGTVELIEQPKKVPWWRRKIF